MFHLFVWTNWRQRIYLHIIAYVIITSQRNQFLRRLIRSSPKRRLISRFLNVYRSTHPRDLLTCTMCAHACTFVYKSYVPDFYLKKKKNSSNAGKVNKLPTMLTAILFVRWRILVFVRVKTFSLFIVFIEEIMKI